MSPRALWAIGVGLLASAAPSGIAQELAHLQVEKVGGGFQFVKGPVWSREGFLVFSDVPANKIFHFAPPQSEKERSRAAVFRDDSGGANGNAFDTQGRLYTCEAHRRRVVRTDRKGKLDVLAESWEGKRFNSPSDIIVRHDGHVYFTDPAFGSAADHRELDFYGIFHITPKGELSVVAKWQTRPNGIALSPDGKLLYVTDADQHVIRAFDLDHAGAASNERSMIPSIQGVPNGLRVDAKGNLYVSAKSVFLYSPAGQLIGEIPTAETPSNCAFGDEDFTSLYITAHGSIYRTNLGVKGSVQY